VLAFGAEMGVDYERLLRMSWLEYDYISTGYYIRMERQWDLNRNIIASMFNSSGFSKKRVKPTDVMKLSTIDKIRSVEFKPLTDEKIKQMLGKMKRND